MSARLQETISVNILHSSKHKRGHARPGADTRATRNISLNSRLSEVPPDPTKICLIKKQARKNVAFFTAI